MLHSCLCASTASVVSRRSSNMKSAKDVPISYAINTTRNKGLNQSKYRIPGQESRRDCESGLHCSYPENLTMKERVHRWSHLSSRLDTHGTGELFIGPESGSNMGYGGCATTSMDLQKYIIQELHESSKEPDIQITSTSMPISIPRTILTMNTDNNLSDVCEGSTVIAATSNENILRSDSSVEESEEESLCSCSHDDSGICRTSSDSSSAGPDWDLENDGRRYCLDSKKICRTSSSLSRSSQSDYCRCSLSSQSNYGSLSDDSPSKSTDSHTIAELDKTDFADQRFNLVRRGRSRYIMCSDSVFLDDEVSISGLLSDAAEQGNEDDRYDDVFYGVNASAPDAYLCLNRPLGTKNNFIRSSGALVKDERQANAVLDHSTPNQTSFPRQVFNENRLSSISISYPPSTAGRIPRSISVVPRMGTKISFQSSKQDLHTKRLVASASARRNLSRISVRKANISSPIYDEPWNETKAFLTDCDFNNVGRWSTPKCFHHIVKGCNDTDPNRLDFEVAFESRPTANQKVQIDSYRIPDRFKNCDKWSDSGEVIYEDILDEEKDYDNSAKVHLKCDSNANIYSLEVAVDDITIPAPDFKYQSTVEGKEKSRVNSLKEIYSRYADVMYTNQQNLAHTIAIQQQLFQQQLNSSDSQVNTGDSNKDKDNTNMECNEVDARKQNVQCGSELNYKIADSNQNRFSSKICHCDFSCRGDSDANNDNSSCGVSSRCEKTRSSKNYNNNDYSGCRCNSNSEKDNICKSSSNFSTSSSSLTCSCSSCNDNTREIQSTSASHTNRSVDRVTDDSVCTNINNIETSSSDCKHLDNYQGPSDQETIRIAGEMEWVAKRRVDGSRYIIRRPVKPSRSLSRRPKHKYNMHDKINSTAEHCSMFSDSCCEIFDNLMKPLASAHGNYFDNGHTTVESKSKNFSYVNQRELRNHVRQSQRDSRHNEKHGFNVNNSNQLVVFTV